MNRLIEILKLLFWGKETTINLDDTLYLKGNYNRPSPVSIDKHRQILKANRVVVVFPDGKEKVIKDRFGNG